jgi:hypothetical protein
MGLLWYHSISGVYAQQVLSHYAFPFFSRTLLLHLLRLCLLFAFSAAALRRYRAHRAARSISAADGASQLSQPSAGEEPCSRRASGSRADLQYGLPWLAIGNPSLSRQMAAARVWQLA